MNTYHVGISNGNHLKLLGFDAVEDGEVGTLRKEFGVRSLTNNKYINK